MRPLASRRLGFSQMEVIVALLLILVACQLVFLSWQRSHELADQSRHRAAAVLLTQTLLEEVRAHPFGSPAPSEWEAGSRPPLQTWISGRAQPVVLRSKVTCQTGAFVGRVPGVTDLVSIEVVWDSSPHTPPGRLDVKVPVWRD